MEELIALGRTAIDTWVTFLMVISMGKERYFFLRMSFSLGNGHMVSRWELVCLPKVMVQNVLVAFSRGSLYPRSNSLQKLTLKVRPVYDKGVI